LSLPELPPPPLGSTWNQWGESLNKFLVKTRNKLGQLTTGESAADEGVIMWDRSEEQVVVSRGGAYEALRYGHSDHMLAYTTATHSAASSNTAYAITWENNPISQHIAVDDTVTSRIVFDHAGTYKINFTAELQSGNNSSKTIYIWPRINGVDVPFSTMAHSIKNSGESQVVTRSGIFQVNADDYLEAYFAVTDTGLTIQGSAATAFSPAAPSASIIVTEVSI
jgi:3D (Asp-Asp-Asp) domain-containing protein